MLESPRSLHHSRGTRREAACRPTLQRIRAVVNPEAVAEEIKQGGQAGVFFAFSISFSVLFQVMAHIMHTLSQSSAPPTLFQDSSPWCDLSSFELFEEAAFSPSQQHAGKALQLQQREGNGNRPAREPSKGKLSEGSLGPRKPVPPARQSTVPLVILRTKRRQASPLATGDSRAFVVADVSSSTPSRSPAKSLSFSPSQVEHGFCTAVTNFQQKIEP